MRLLWLRILSR